MRDDIPQQDIKRLKLADICPIEDPKTRVEQPGRLTSITKLYEPLASNRMLELPILYWKGNFMPNSQEARFLKFLGLRPFPSGDEVVRIMASTAAQNRQALWTYSQQYYIENYEKNNYNMLPKSGIRSFRFLLVEGSPFPKVVPPQQCYANPKAAILGYPILDRSLRDHAGKFGVQFDPDIHGCVDCILANPPLSVADTRLAK